MYPKTKIHFKNLDGGNSLKMRSDFWYDFPIQILRCLLYQLKTNNTNNHQMVKEKTVKQPKVTKVTKAKGALLVSSQPTHALSNSPVTRSNTATVRDGNPILDANEQKQFKMWMSEIKQIQGLVICRVGLNIQERSTCAQAIQENLFVTDFPIIYEDLCKHPMLGNRVKKIPLVYLTVGTSTAIEVISGEKMRKKYSTMKTYINNTLSPIYKRYDQSG